MFLPWMILFVVPCQSSPGTVWWKFWFEWRLYQRQFYDTEIDTELGWHWCGCDSLHVRFVWQPSCIDNWGPIGLDTTDWRNRTHNNADTVTMQVHWTFALLCICQLLMHCLNGPSTHSDVMLKIKPHLWSTLSELWSCLCILSAGVRVGKSLLDW